MRETMASNTKGSKWDITYSVKLIVAEVSQWEVKDIRVDMHLEKDIGLDSLDRHELALIAWSRFELEEDIPPDELRKITTVRELSDVIIKYTLSI